LEDLGIDGKLASELFLNKQDWKSMTGSIRLMMSSCGSVNELSGSVKNWKCLD
jgi:hypothetical protein